MYDSPDISVVIPVFNERENLRPLFEGIREVLDDMGRTWELLFVDDGSTDGSYAVQQDLALLDGHVRVVRLRRNFGQTAAMSAGFDHAQGEIIITMDGDLQNDPTDIPMLVETLETGYDIVSGWRKGRKDPLISKRFPSFISNKVASWVTGVKLHDYGCTLKAYRKEILDEIHLYGELHRFIPALAGAIGARVGEVEVKHHARTNGKSKYGVGRLLRGFLDILSLKLLISYSTRPMQIFGGLGMLSILMGIFSAGATVTMKLAIGTNMTGNPLLYLTILAVLVGIQFITMGFLGEINIRTYHESVKKPIYVIRDVIGEKSEKLALMR
ncbi:MAG: glycosyltransferase family 2 protein [Chloroflexi bacterium]|nr:glycosyltransferase family 2 protein [Chloroflexota bacterium]